MGRMHPVECPHGKIMDPGSFDIATEDCAECDVERERVKTERIHRICPYLRDLKDCNKCPSSEPPLPGYEEYGRTQRGCYGLAEEVYNIAVYGNEERAYRRLKMTDIADALSWEAEDFAIRPETARAAVEEIKALRSKLGKYRRALDAIASGRTIDGDMIVSGDMMHIALGALSDE